MARRFFEDDVSGFGPDKEFGVGVVRTQVALDGGLEAGDAGQLSLRDAQPG